MEELILSQVPSKFVESQCGDESVSKRLTRMSQEEKEGRYSYFGGKLNALDLKYYLGFKQVTLKKKKWASYNLEIVSVCLPRQT